MALLRNPPLETFIFKSVDLTAFEIITHTFWVDNTESEVCLYVCFVLPVDQEVVEDETQHRGNCGSDGDVTLKVVLHTRPKKKA